METRIISIEQLRTLLLLTGTINENCDTQQFINKDFMLNILAVLNRFYEQFEPGLEISDANFKISLGGKITDLIITFETRAEY